MDGMEVTVREAWRGTSTARMFSRKASRATAPPLEWERSHEPKPTQPRPGGFRAGHGRCGGPRPRRGPEDRRLPLGADREGTDLRRCGEYAPPDRCQSDHPVFLRP